MASSPIKQRRCCSRRAARTGVESGPRAEVSLELWDEGYGNFDLGFTRGYISSQAYAERFHNQPVEPSPPSIDFDTKPYAERYSWLGSHAGKLIFEFLDETVSDPKRSLDIFAYDLNEPDLIRKMQALGSRLRLYLDNSSSHVAAKGDKTPRARSRRLQRSPSRRERETSRSGTSSDLPITRS